MPSHPGSFSRPPLLYLWPQNFSHCVSNGNLRGKLLLCEKLETIIHALYPTRPQLVVKYAVPAALSLVSAELEEGKVVRGVRAWEGRAWGG